MRRLFQIILGIALLTSLNTINGINEVLTVDHYISNVFDRDTSTPGLAINVSKFKSEQIEPGESITNVERTDIPSSQFPFGMALYGRIFYYYSIDLRSSSNPSQVIHIIGYEPDLTYESVMELAQGNQIESVNYYYSEASMLEIEHRKDSVTGDLVATDYIYGRDPFRYMHGSVSGNGGTLVNHSGDVLTLSTRQIPNYSYLSTEKSWNDTTFTSKYYKAVIIYGRSYTVTYNDGVLNETVFEDQTSSVSYGSSTPQFNGTPHRLGYSFNGWSPTVSPTVTSSITYEAQWIANAYDVVYTDGVLNETVFEDQTSSVSYGSLTPQFNGTPHRLGYSFNGWSPTVSPTVTSSITYEAQWTILKDEGKKEELTPSESVQKDVLPNTGVSNISIMYALIMIGTGLVIILIGVIRRKRK